MTIQPGEIWIADIPFTDASGAKKRPVLVLWLDGTDLVAASVTSAAPRSATDVPLAGWQASGLRVPSTVRLSRLDCLEQSLMIARLGKLTQSDADKIKEVWLKKIQLQF
ncbi:MAG: type II toxin-antitoxin system PemK/MazF family toxin [Bythopirellula sp.]|nr:type II toxin-antitoxin system PemK/MazF family toxin [Bythopirellula sp.]